MKRVLITGAAGSLGSALHKLLIDKEYSNTYEILAAGSHADPEKNLIGLDITKEEDVEHLVSSWKPNIIVNCAAFTAVDLCEAVEEKAYAVNVTGVKNLAQSAEKIGAVLFHISTDYVFAGDSKRPYREEDETNPVSVYGRTKLEGELAVKENCSKYMLLRTAWVYGEKKSFVATMQRLAASGNPIRVVDDQIGAPTSAEALARAIVYLLPSDKYGVINVTCNGHVSWYGFAKYIFECTKQQVELQPIKTKDFPTKAARPAYSVLDMTKLNNEYGYVMPNWQEALESYLKAN